MVTVPEQKSAERTARGQQREAVGEDGEQERAEQRADGGAPAAGQAGAADDHRREDREQQLDWPAFGLAEPMNEKSSSAARQAMQAQMMNARKM